MPIHLFEGSGQWYRGNVHSHTTNSDGLFGLNELATWYARHGYDFLFVTDHNLVTDVSGHPSRKILVLPGAEIGVKWQETFPAEVLALGIQRMAGYMASPQRVIDEVLEQGGIPFLSHPSLSGISSAAISRLKGLVGIEIFNAPNHWNGRRGDSTAQWDELLAGGHRLWGVASDDRHSGVRPELTFAPLGRQPFRDQAEAWIMVWARTRTSAEILEAIRQGRFYSTTGPRIEEIAVEDGEIRVKTTPVRSVWFASSPWLGVRRVAPAGDRLTEARAPLSALATPGKIAEMTERFLDRGYWERPRVVGCYVRIELWDGEDGRAWSNPIDLSREGEPPWRCPDDGSR